MTQISKNEVSVRQGGTHELLEKGIGGFCGNNAEQTFRFITNKSTTYFISQNANSESNLIAFNYISTAVSSYY